MPTPDDFKALKGKINTISTGNIYNDLAGDDKLNYLNHTKELQRFMTRQAEIDKSLKKRKSDQNLTQATFICGRR